MALRLGLVTYQLAKDWDVDTIIANCIEAEFEGVECRTTHAHGVEVEVYGARKLTAATLIQAATRFVPIDGDLLLSS